MRKMRKMKERIVSLALTFVMVMSLLVGMAPVEVRAEEGEPAAQAETCTVTIDSTNLAEGALLAAVKFDSDGYDMDEPIELTNGSTVEIPVGGGLLVMSNSSNFKVTVSDTTLAEVGDLMVGTAESGYYISEIKGNITVVVESTTPSTDSCTVTIDSTNLAEGALLAALRFDSDGYEMGEPIELTNGSTVEIPKDGGLLVMSNSSNFKVTVSDTTLAKVGDLMVGQAESGYYISEIKGNITVVVESTTQGGGNENPPGGGDEDGDGVTGDISSVTITNHIFDDIFADIQDGTLNSYSNEDLYLHAWPKVTVLNKNGEVLKTYINNPYIAHRTNSGWEVCDCGNTLNDSEHGILLLFQTDYNHGNDQEDLTSIVSIDSNTLVIDKAWADYSIYPRSGAIYVAIVPGSSGGNENPPTAPITINTQPKSVTINSGEKATFTVEAVAANGGQLSYQWQVDYGSGSGFVKTYEPGNNTATLTTYPTDASYNGYKYRCIITDESGNSVTSEEVTLTINVLSKPTEITGVSITKTANGYKVTGLGAAGEGYKWGYYPYKLSDGDNLEEVIAAKLAEHLTYGPWESETLNIFDESYEIATYRSWSGETESIDNCDYIEIMKLDENHMIREVAVLALPKNAAPSDDNLIKAVDVQVDWTKVPDLEKGMTEVPMINGVPGTYTVNGAFVYGASWAMKVDESYKITQEDSYYNELKETKGEAFINSYNSEIDRYIKVYSGMLPLNIIFKNPYYAINEEDTYAMYIGFMADEGKTFGGSAGEEYIGELTSNLDIVCQFVDGRGEGLIVFFELGTLAEMEQEKNEASGGTTVHTHSLTLVPAKAATCTEAGNKAYYTCSGCDVLFANANGTITTTASAVKIAALGHDWSGEWTVTKEATTTETGKKETLCVNGCGQKKVVVIPTVGTIEEDSNIEKDAEVAPDVAIDEATLDNTKEELLNAGSIFDETEKQLIENGADARVWLEITKTENTDMSSAEKAKMEEKAAEIMGDDVKITYFEADLFKQVGTTVTEISEPGIKIKVTITIPAELLNTDEAVTREYKILRLHDDGQLDVLSGTFNAETGEFSFETDKFSTYAIVYADAPANDGNNSSSLVPYIASGLKDVVPKTGESNASAFFLALMVLSGFGVVLCTPKKKRY